MWEIEKRTEKPDRSIGPGYILYSSLSPSRKERGLESSFQGVMRIKTLSKVVLYHKNRT